MNSDVEFNIRNNIPWNKWPANTKQALGGSQKEYEKAVVSYSIKNQLRYKGNLVRTIKKDEKKYYEALIHYSKEHLMLYPYHLSDVIVKGLRITPFAYYIDIMSDIMKQEKSYDALPNFTAADCLRLLGIGRNQYIDLMNQTRTSKAHRFFGKKPVRDVLPLTPVENIIVQSWWMVQAGYITEDDVKRFFGKKPVRDLLPLTPVENIAVESWWMVQAGCITEDDVKVCTPSEKTMIDCIIDSGPQQTGTLDYKTLLSLYRKGLLYVDITIADEDCITVPPLEGFVMNRVLGDYFENLLYKIFVSIDEHTTVAELANVLQIDLQLVKNAVSMYCRLGFARRKGYEFDADDLHPSWRELKPNPVSKKPAPEELLIDWSTTEGEPITVEKTPSTPDNLSLEGTVGADLWQKDQITGIDSTSTCGHSKRIAFLFDSTLTAFLMMGNLSPGLKSHAVTMFEVGKLSDETMDSFLAELEKVDSTAEGEAQRYFDHAITLRDTVKFLRYNKALCADPEFNNTGSGVDLLRCESLLGLDPGTCARLLNKNYSLLVSMAPLSNEIQPITSCTPQHIGPAIPEVSSMWFKLYTYHLTGSGPPSLLLVKGTKLRRLPKVLQDYEKLFITTWGHDPAVIATSNILLTLNDALTHSAVMIQGYGWQGDGCTAFVPFPFCDGSSDTGAMYKNELQNHSAIRKLSSYIDLHHSCGFITLLKTGMRNQINVSLNNSRHSSFNEQSPSVDRSSANSDKPINGIKDLKSAEILASEIDSLDQFSSKSNKPLSLDLYLDDSESLSSDTPCDQSCDSVIEADWTLLDCCFGIPLFDAYVNKEVCERIVSKGICNRDSLQELLHSSRKLSLSLLDFIAEHLDAPLSEDSIVDPLTQVGVAVKGCATLPYPTHNIIFYNGKLETWNGH